MRHRKLSSAAIITAVSLAGAYTVAQSPQRASSETGTAWTNDEGEWTPLPDIFPEGGQMKVMHGNPAEGPADFYFLFPSEYGVPWHFHTPVEKVLMDRGTMEFVMRDGEQVSLSEGGFIHFPSRSPHEAACTSNEDCYFYLTSNDRFDIHLVNEEDWTVTESWTAGE